MRTILIILIAGLLNLTCEAQWSYKYLSKEKHFLYSSGDYFVGKKSNNSGKVSVNYVYDNKYTLNVGFSATSKNNPQLPQEILKSTEELIPLNSATPFSNSENIHLMVGRVLNLNKEGTIRFLIQGGPGLYTSRDPVYKINSNSYNFDIEASKSLCLVLNPKFEMPLCCTIGFSAGPMLLINGNETYMGIGIGLMYGILGK